MGRCYEFGVVIQDECDHPMVVSPEGGACVCGSCGASCLGRFSGCAAILAMPGHVPIAAPRAAMTAKHARRTVPLRPPPSEEQAPEVLAMPALPAELIETPAPTTAPAPVDDVRLGDLVEVFRHALDRPDRAAALLVDLRQELVTRDAELAAAFDRLATQQDRLATELAADRVARECLVESMAEVTDRLQTIEKSLAELTLPRPELDETRAMLAEVRLAGASMAETITGITERLGAVEEAATVPHDDEGLAVIASELLTERTAREVMIASVVEFGERLEALEQASATPAATPPTTGIWVPGEAQSTL
jgi:uncharacterized coiled-coil protein SlyX